MVAHYFIDADSGCFFVAIGRLSYAFFNMGKKEPNICPYCREEVAQGAVVCRHCRSTIKPLKNKKKIPFLLSKFMLGLYSGAILIILLNIVCNKWFGGD